MATNRTNIGSKFQNTDIPSEADFKEIFDSFVHKDEDKASFQMVEVGTDTDHYVTPALLRTSLQNTGIITGNSFMPYKEYFEDSFTGTTLSLEKLPVQNSVKIFKNGQLLQESEDYSVNYETAVITFSDTVSNRNLEVDYWYKNLSPNPGSGSSTAIDFTSFLHTSGNETKNGLLTFNNTTATSTSGIILKNSGTGAATTSLDITNSGAGSGISLQNSSTGTGVKVSNAGAGVAVNINSATGSTGDVLQVTKNNVVTAKIDNEGNVTAEKFVSSGGLRSEFVKGDGFLDPTVYAKDTDVLHILGNESKDGALNLTHDTSVEDVLTITKNNSANCLKLVQNSSSNATTSTFYTDTPNVNRKAISIQKGENENAFITHDGNVSGTSFTTLNEKADITDGFLTLAGSTSPAAMADHAKLYAKKDGSNTDMYVMGSDGVEKKIGGVVDLSGVILKTTNQSFTGIKSAINSGSTQVNGFSASNSGTGFSAGYTSTNSGSAQGIYSTNSGSGQSIYSTNSGSGKSIYSDNTGSGINMFLNNFTTGKNLVINNAASATGTPFTIQKNGVDKATISETGVFSGTGFIKTGGTSSQYLMADGSVTISNPEISSNKEYVAKIKPEDDSVIIFKDDIGSVTITRVQPYAYTIESPNITGYTKVFLTCGINSNTSVTENRRIDYKTQNNQNGQIVILMLKNNVLSPFTNIDSAYIDVKITIYN